MASGRRRKGTSWIGEQRQRNQTFSKRSKGQITKTFGLNSLTGAPVAFIALPTEAIKGEVHYFGSPSVAEVFFEFLHERCKSGMTHEEMACLTMKCQSLLSRLRKRSKVNTGADHESRAEGGNDSNKKFETSHPPLLPFPKDGDDGDECSTSEVNFTTTLTIKEHPSGCIMVCPDN